jgi:hypothetical protein
MLPLPNSKGFFDKGNLLSEGGNACGKQLLRPHRALNKKQHSPTLAEARAALLDITQGLFNQ